MVDNCTAEIRYWNVERSRSLEKALIGTACEALLLLLLREQPFIEGRKTSSPTGTQAQVLLLREQHLR